MFPKRLAPAEADCGALLIHVVIVVGGAYPTIFIKINVKILKEKQIYVKYLNFGNGR